MNNVPVLIGPFRQLLTMRNLPLKGAISDEQLEIIEEGGILFLNGEIKQIGKFDDMGADLAPGNIIFLQEDLLAFPGLIDAHTHICFAGSRARDYSMRVAGKTYLEIAKEGGGIWDTVTQTRAASEEDLQQLVLKRARFLRKNGVTTVEVKSGYGLSVEEELKMLRAIKKADQELNMLVPTCLAAHIPPKDFDGSPNSYLYQIHSSLWPLLQKERLCNRIDIFVEEGAFGIEEARNYLQAAKDFHFDITLHVDQFHPGGSHLAVELEALSADHLEASGDKEIELLAGSNVIPVALPGASLGLGDRFAPARKLLDAGASLAIASDWNPGSAPMGDLLIQASILGAHQKLSMAETWAGMTFRAAAALNLQDRGVLDVGKRADMIAFSGKDYREVLYHQGLLKPSHVWQNGFPHLIQSETHV
ncbi:MAG: imidazolonepropionase [Bacteroidia bacterium]|nr:imidazolonepropionase [Bacteroidia bacterium]